ncbi:MAG: nuclear transport factor 2 family protein [Syntrophomonadaceae bacterium]
MVRAAAALVAASIVLGAAACARREEPAPPAPAGGMLEKEALKLVARYDDAWMRKDLHAIGRLLAPEYVYFSSKGDVSDLAATRAMLSSQGYRLERGQRDDLKAYRFGETVVVRSHWTGAGVFDGKPFTDDQRCSVVVAFSGGSPRILSEHCTRLTSP